MVGGITDSMDMNLSKLQETVEDSEACHMLQSMGSQRVGCDLATEQQQHPFKNVLPATPGYCSSGC